jgi:hypothetical protein
MKYIPVFHRYAASKAVQMSSILICQSLNVGRLHGVLSALPDTKIVASSGGYER